MADQTEKPGDEVPEGTPDAGENLCPDCSGSGKQGDRPCPTCDGTGTVMEAIGGG
jgi:hypothetical protein